MTHQEHRHTIDESRVPQHVAIIMDGNGRWAKERGLDRSRGHLEGITAVRRITEAAAAAGVKYLTLYTFSTENWNRPREEVDALMGFIVMALEREAADLIKNNVSLRVIGDMDRLPDAARNGLQKCIDDSSHCTGLRLILAISYSSRWEITEAARTIAKRVAQGELTADQITADTVSQSLTTAAYPDPDLMIRTGGDFRISNFLLWQLAYSEIVVSTKYWPDFGRDDLLDAIAQYQGRERRFGLTGDQIRGNSNPQ